MSLKQEMPQASVECDLFGVFTFCIIETFKQGQWHTKPNQMETK